MSGSVRLALALGVFLAGATGGVGHAAPGTLDSSFGSGGTVATNMARDTPDLINEGISDVAIQQDGKIVAVGWARRKASPGGEGGIVFAIARFTRRGTLDRTFGGDGTRLTGFRTRHAYAGAVAIQADGKIVVAGWAGGFFAVARYTSSGKRDRSFGRNGRRLTDLTTGGDFASDVALQPNGKILLAGRAGGSGGRFALVRYLASGRRDRSFGVGGKVMTDFGPRDDPAFGMTLQADGRIVLVGAVAYLASGQWGLARYERDGSLDMTFSGDGKAGIDITGDSDWANEVVAQADGTILVGGAASFGFTDVALARLDTAGTLDPTFGDGGLVVRDLGGDFDEARDIAVQPDGKIVVVGERFSKFVVARFEQDGAPDLPFGGGDGKASTAIGRGSSSATALTIQRDARIVVAGEARNVSRFGLARFLAE